MWWQLLALMAGGSIEGTVFFDGVPPSMPELKRVSDPFCARTRAWDQSVLVRDGKLANVVVRVLDAPPTAPPPDTAFIEQVDCNYRPRVSAAVAGQPLEIVNRDPTLHNVHRYVGTTTHH